jgi:hypothetical protein
MFCRFSTGWRVLDLATGKLVIPKAILSRYPQVKHIRGWILPTYDTMEKRDWI